MYPTHLGVSPTVGKVDLRRGAGIERHVGQNAQTKSERFSQEKTTHAILEYLRKIYGLGYST